MWPGEYPPEGHGDLGGVRLDPIASMWPGEYPPEGRRSWGGRGRRRRRLQCGRGSIPRKVGRRRFFRLCSRSLQCGRGSIPRKVVVRAPVCERLYAASMWPGEYPPEGRRYLRAGRVEVVIASMWPGEYPPEGHRSAGLVVLGPRASMWPGEYPPEGHLEASAFLSAPAPASMWPGEYPPEGHHRGERPPALDLHRFNVAGGVSPGRSPTTIVTWDEVYKASMWPGEYPPEGQFPPYASASLSTASMWPGEYPPEGRRRGQHRRTEPQRLQCGRGSIPRKVAGMNRRAPASPALQCGRGSIPRKVPGRPPTPSGPPPGLQCGRGSIPRKVVASTSRQAQPKELSFNVAGGVSPGRSPHTRPEGPTGRRFNVAGGVSPGRSWGKQRSVCDTQRFNVAGGVSPGRSTSPHPFV